jgi:hypothetical protein
MAQSVGLELGGSPGCVVGSFGNLNSYVLARTPLLLSIGPNARVLKAGTLVSSKSGKLVECLLLALSGHSSRARDCPLLDQQRTKAVALSVEAAVIQIEG